MIVILVSMSQPKPKTSKNDDQADKDCDNRQNDGRATHFLDLLMHLHYCEDIVASMGN